MTVTKRPAAMASYARKTVAAVAAGALVASLGYFHLWGSAPAEAANGKDQVEVFFTLDDDVTVTANKETFDALSDEACLASTGEDFHFTAEVGHNDREIGTVSAEMRTTASASAKEASPASVEADESSDSEPAASSLSEAVGVVEIVPEVTPIPETAAALEKKRLAEEGESADQATSTDSVDQVTATEQLEDDATPMAASPTAGDQGEVVEVEVTYDQESNEYIISKEDLKHAAQAGGALHVAITSDAQGETCDNWDALAEALTSGDEGKVKLTGDVEATSTVVVKGDKTLDLNGHTITSKVEGALFKVGDADASATFTINDSASKYANLETVSEGLELPKPNKDNAGDLIKKVMGEFREKWVGKQASVEGDTLTYYVTRSYEDENTAGVTTEYQIKHEVNMEKVGTIEAQTAQDLVVVDNGGSTLNIEGGRLSYQKDVKGDIHAVNLNKGGTFHMSGGFITGAYTEGLGAAVSANNSAANPNIQITIDGNAVIAGNKTVKNGGAIWMSSEAAWKPEAEESSAKLVVGGNAVIAGNVAGEKPLAVDKDTKKDELTKGTIATTRNGGGIYIRKNCEVVITGSAVIAGNTANADGGGIYIEGHAKGSTATRNKLTIEENAMITNNRSENDRSSKHQTDRSQGPANETNFWKNYGGGGGGVFTQDETIVNGGQITANFASDGGGGILALGGNVTIPVNWKGELIEKDKRENALPELKIENCRISSNYAGTSEGGGICAGTAKSSYIKSGIISNNMTATYFDYGGGGLFMSSIDRYEDKGTSKSTAGITVHHPLVTGNTAAGFGGGVASCTNGVVMSCDAAVFDNTALEKNTTQNPNEFGDQWMIEGNLRKDEFEKSGLKTYGLKDKIEKGFANDFYCARKATVFNTMLGGGYYNWKGYTTGTVTGGEASAIREDYKKPTYVTFNGKDRLDVHNVFIRTKDKEKNPLTDEKGNTVDTALILRVDESQVKDAKRLVGYIVSIDTIDEADGKPVQKTALVTGVHGELDPYDDADDGVGTAVALFVDFSVNVSQYQAQKTDIELKGAYTTTPGDDSPRNYPMQKVNELTKTDTTCVTSDRLMFLTADPSDGDKQAARNEAVLFFTGNYSNTHGGAIACNDYIDVGAADKEIPEKPDDVTGKLTLTKKLTGWNTSQGSATAIFNVTGYKDVEAYKAHLAPIYVNQIGFTFNADGSETRELTRLPLGYYVVEEVFYSGDNFKEATGRNTWTGTLTKDNAEAGLSAEFTNTFKDDKTFATGVVNSYEPKQDENGLFSYTDGKLTYTPDENYNKRKEPTAPIEGGN
ncbi:hypothetical protein VJ918_06755 [Adlercreutzia sp. R21]|uniref:hypothetical protein n=1 Tax=Adlercreutzia wanghongyangiae TaxID=3111451 RepID=UPI002DBF726D|nr:hypothetical protein [Adlercreutzia sp. R21]MEC4184507.1 hypothetical protein [Adlercreutzia sp. R21]